jgi:hypothetical protein
MVGIMNGHECPPTQLGESDEAVLMLNEPKSQVKVASLGYTKILKRMVLRGYEAKGHQCQGRWEMSDEAGLVR